MAQPSFASANRTSNNTGDSYEWRFCPTAPALPPTNSFVPYIVNATVNLSMAVVTTLANLLVLVALRRVTSLRLPFKILLYSLVLTDLGSGLLAQPQIAAIAWLRWFSQADLSFRQQLELSIYLTAALFSSASLFFMIGISTDRYTALYYHLRYRQLITSRRALAYVTLSSLIAVIFASSYVWNREFYTAFTICGISITFLVISVAYIMIFRGLRSNQVQPAHNPAPSQPAGTTPHLSSYRKTASAMLWVYSIFIICYLPHVVIFTVIAVVGCTPRLHFIQQLCYTPVLLNSFINPLVYTFTIREIRREVWRQIQKVVCCFAQ